MALCTWDRGEKRTYRLLQKIRQLKTVFNQVLMKAFGRFGAIQFLNGRKLVYGEIFRLFSRVLFTLMTATFFHKHHPMNYRAESLWIAQNPILFPVVVRLRFQIHRQRFDSTCQLWQLSVRLWQLSVIHHLRELYGNGH